MEFSVSKAIDRLRPSVTKKSYLNVSSTPSKSLIIPGIGHCLRSTSFTVALPRKPNDSYHLTKKTTEEIQDVPDIQAGAGETKVADTQSKILLHSMKHPKMIETTSVTFAKKPVKRSLQKGEGVEVPIKKLHPSKKNVPHKFSFF